MTNLNTFRAGLLLASALMTIGRCPVVAETVNSSASQGVSLTIYNQNFGVVKDVREVQLKDGINYLRFEDVAAKIDPTSVSFRSLTAPNAVAVQEQNYQYDLLNTNTILAKSVGKRVKFKQFLPTGAVEFSGILLNPPASIVSNVNGRQSTVEQGLVVKTDNGVVLNPSGQIELAELPAGLISKPSLLWKLDCNKSGRHQSEISYQTSDINWRCDYVFVVNDDNSSTDLTSWVTLENQSGASYKDASLKLMAGDVNRVVGLVEPRYGQSNDKSLGMIAAKRQQFQENAFAEYHLYTLQGKTDVNDKETKQLTLFSANDVPSKKRFIFESNGQEGENLEVNTKLEIENKESNHLGMPMPKGKIRVYQRDKDGALEFIGEDAINHTARDEKIRVYLGDAFDVVAERHQTGVQRISNHLQKESYIIKIRNHKKTAVEVTATEHAYGDWKILSSGQPYAKKDSNTFEFTLKVPANGDVEVAYEVQLKG
jgi:hypothetical protein